jgi:hypothetical protein
MGDRPGCALRTGGLWPNWRAVAQCPPDAWGRSSFFCLYPAVLLFRGINNSQHPLGAGMKMHMFHSDRLLIAAPMLVERLNQLKLKLDQSNSIAAPNIDVCVLLVTQTEV